MSVWLLIYMGVSVQIDSRILVLASTGQGNLQKKVPVRRHPASQPVARHVASALLNTCPALMGGRYLHQPNRHVRTQRPDCNDVIHIHTSTEGGSMARSQGV